MNYILMKDHHLVIFSQQLDIIVSHVHIHSHSFLHILLPTKLLWNYGTYILDIANSLYMLMHKSFINYFAFEQNWGKN